MTSRLHLKKKRCKCQFLWVLKLDTYCEVDFGFGVIFTPTVKHKRFWPQSGKCKPRTILLRSKIDYCLPSLAPPRWPVTCAGGHARIRKPSKQLPTIATRVPRSSQKRTYFHLWG